MLSGINQILNERIIDPWWVIFLFFTDEAFVKFSNRIGPVNYFSSKGGDWND